MRTGLGALEWLTETAVKHVGLPTYTEFLKTAHEPKKIGDDLKFMALAFLVWGGGFLYVHQPLAAGIVFVLMCAFHGILFLGTTQNGWMPDGISSAHVLMITGALTVMLWWLSVVIPYQLIPGKPKGRTRFLFLFFLIYAVVGAVVMSQIVLLLKQKKISGFQVEPEIFWIALFWVVALWRVLQGATVDLLSYVNRKMPSDRAPNNPWEYVSLGFTSALIVVSAAAYVLTGPLAPACTYILQRLIQVTTAYGFEAGPAFLAALVAHL